jgi:hypothetical protein
MHLLMNKTHVAEKFQVNVEFPQVVLFPVSFYSKRAKALVKPKHFNIISFVLTEEISIAAASKALQVMNLRTLERFESLYNFHDILKKLEMPK